MWNDKHSRPTVRARRTNRTGRRYELCATVALASSTAACQGAELAPAASDPVTGAERRDDDGCDWNQHGGDARHSGAACRGIDRFERVAAQLTFDPFVPQESAVFGLFAHYQAPLLVDDDVYMEVKTGTFTTRRNRNSQVWTERAFHWADGQLVADWTFVSDWKTVPNRLAFFEPVFHAAVVGAFVYVPGAAGALHKVDRRTGQEVATIRLPGVGDDPNTFVAGGLAADRHGNVYYNALALRPNVLDDPRGAWLVKVHPDDTVTLADFATIVTGAPDANDACVTQFSDDQAPWPPSPDAVAPSARCGPQRPPINVTPAVGDDGTVVTISTAHANLAYSFVVAVDANLAPKWATSLRGQLHDGCGVLVPADAPPDTTDPGLLLNDCRIGAPLGVDPTTNLPPAGLASDDGTSSPVILPDGGVLYGADTFYNQLRGHLFKFDRHGRPVATYDFGWDVTPAVHRHDGTYSIVTKDNRYAEGRYFVSQLDADLHPEWSFEAPRSGACQRDATGNVVCTDDPEFPGGREWCVNAPAVDPRGNVYLNNEDGWVYKIGQGGRLVDRMFLLQPLAAGYTPISLDRHGRLYAINAGDLFAIEGRRDEHRDHDDHGDD